MKVVLQDGIKDCGVCCLLSIIKHYGGNVSKEYLRELTNTTKSGVSAYKLKEAAERLGFNVIALTGKIEEIDVNNLPCIAHVILNKSYQHFIVIYDIDFKINKVLIMDPAKGKRIITINEFKLMTSNNYLFLTPIKKLPIFSEKKVIKDTIVEFVRNKKSYLFFLIILTTSYFILNILSAFHFKYLLDYSINYNISNNVALISFTMLIIYLCKEISLYLRNVLLLKYSEILDLNITMKTYKQIILLPYLYYKNRTSGEIISRLKDLSIIKTFLASVLCFLTTDILSVLIFIVLLVNLNAKLTLISIIMMSILLIINLCIRRLKLKKISRYYRNEEKINSYLIESLSGVDAIKGMHIEKIILDRFNLKYKKLLEAVYQLSLLEEALSFLKNNINNIFTIFILYFGTIFVIEGKITLSEFIVFQSILGFYTSSFKNIIDLINEYPNYKLSIERVEDLFTIRKEIFTGGHYYNIKTLEGNIKYNNLSYSYNGKKLLSNINLEIYPKDKIFFYGPSGVGKSTLVKILMRYIDVPFGKVSINDIDINHYHLDILRQNITYVSQQEFLFNDTIYNNITLNKDIKKEEVEEAIKLTMVDEIIKDDKLSYNKLVEENGFNFSGGERQRIILARTILKKSDIYIFDEALSQIDILREKKILLNIFSYLKDKTIIVISHRFNNKDLFMRIISLNNGTLNEEKL